jgi:anti-anti-sigma factor
MPFLHRLSFRLTLITTVFLITLGGLASALIIGGFQQTQRQATERSSALLTVQARDALRMVILREAQISAEQLLAAPAAAHHATGAMLDMARIGASVPVDVSRELMSQPDGWYGDTSPDRQSDTYLPKSRRLDEAVVQDLRDSAVLESLFPAILQQDQDIVAIYYVGSTDFSRYYPVINLGEAIGADYITTLNQIFVLADPINNPQRASVWTPPYLDPAGQGLLVTSSTPVYEGDTFRGVISIDLSLTRLITRLESIKMTPNSYAFLVDADGKLIAAPATALPDLASTSLSAAPTITTTLGLELTTNPSFQQALQAMRSGQAGETELTLGEQPVLLFYAPLPNIGWNLGMVVPVADITTPAQGVATDIQRGNEATLRTTLLTLLVFFLLALGGVMLLSRFLTHPINQLVAGSRAIAAGDLTTKIPIRSRSELGVLADAFNAMTVELATTQQRLKASNEALERTVDERTAELRTQATVLQESLDRQEHLNEMIAALSLPVLPVRDDTLVVPLVGTIDHERGTSLLATVLHAIEKRRARAVVLDVTGLALIDTAIAKALLQTVSATRLLGAETLLVGMRPEVAQTLVALDTGLERLRTAATLQEALELLIKRSKSN